MGVASYLLKPVKQSELLDAIIVALGIEAVEDEAEGRPDEAQLARTGPLRILLAEDSLVNQKLLDAGDLDELTRRAAAFIEQVKKGRGVS